MDSVLYEFKNLSLEGRKSYIFQFVKGRKLTDVYHSHDFYEIIRISKGNISYFKTAWYKNYGAGIAAPLR